MKQKTIILFHRKIYKIGGVETFLFNFCYTLRDYYDITVLYEEIDTDQAAHLFPYAHLERLDPKKEYVCDVAVNNTASWVDYPKNIKADITYSIIHCDYKDYMRIANVKPNFHIGHKFICINKFARDSFVDLFKCKCDVIEGTLQPDFKPNKVLHLVSATRLSIEKGKPRMYQFMNLLRASNIKFDWKIFTNDKFELKEEFPEVQTMKPCYDVIDWIADADYLVQLSDTEALCLAVREALSVGTPVIVTDIPGFDYIKDGVLGYKVPLDMHGIDMQKIYTKIPKVKWSEDKEDILNQWFEKLGNPVKVDKPLYEPKMVKIKVITDYWDIVTGEYYTKGTIREVDEMRAMVLCHPTIERPQLAERIK